jgi:dsRNA-specific ribonuclease
VLAANVLSNSSLKEVALQIPSIPYDKQHLYKFKDEALERRVYTHSLAGAQQNSWSSDEVAAKVDNEYLEFVGDGLLKGILSSVGEKLA